MTNTSTQAPLPPNSSNHQEQPQNSNTVIPPPRPYKISSSIKYMECLKNHAIGIGGNATDGCGEFLAGGEEGTIEALICHVCNCHRNYHRQITIQPCPDPQCCPPDPAPVPALASVGQVTGNQAEKKRFRTKFSQEQKEKMYDFAEKCGWRIQKAGDPDVKSFCEEIGIKRKVFKVWMHNNKYHANKKTSTSSST